MFDVRILGTGGTKPVPIRHLASAYVATEQCHFLFDCGENTQLAFVDAGVRYASLDAVFLTHLHADHVLGLAGLLATMSNGERTRPLYVFGPEGTRDFVDTCIRNFIGLNYRVYAFEMSDDQYSFQFGDCSVTAFTVPHSIKCYGYTLDSYQSPLFDRGRVESSGIPKKYWGLLQEGHSFVYKERLITREGVLGAPRKRLRVSYVVDTAESPKIAEFCSGADLLILEGMYTNECLPATGCVKQHLSFEQAANIAKSAGAKALCLTHFGPRLVHPDFCIGEATAIFPNTFCAYDGLRYTVTYSGGRSTDSRHSCCVRLDEYRAITRHSRNYFSANKREWFKRGEVVQLVVRDKRELKPIYARVTGVDSRSCDRVNLVSIQVLHSEV